MGPYIVPTEVYLSCGGRTRISYAKESYPLDQRPCLSRSQVIHSCRDNHRHLNILLAGNHLYVHLDPRTSRVLLLCLRSNCLSLKNPGIFLSPGFQILHVYKRHMVKTPQLASSYQQLKIGACVIRLFII